MSIPNERLELMEGVNNFMSNLQSSLPESIVDSLTEIPADADPPDGEAELETEGCDQQSTDDHTYNQAPLSYELQQGVRILKELMSDSNKSVNFHFLGPVDDRHPETADYYEKIKKPIWLGKMKEKFDNREYESITQFVADFRQMLENCYRFNGPDHFVSRKAQKMETMMEQKLNLLSRELREKTSIAATSGQQQEDNFPVIPGMRRRSKAIVPHDSTRLLNQLRVEEIQKEREVKRQQMIDRKAVLESHIQGMMEWEDKLMGDQREQVNAMWELPSIGLLLFLCHYPLNIGEVPQFELERCLFMPRESSTLQRVMTTLLSTPFQRYKLDKTGMMPYKVWNEKLRDRIVPWFKLLKDSKDPYKVADKFGLDPFLFQVVGKKNPMKKKKFHELSLYSRVWLLKSLCDHCVESQESLVKTIESQYPEEQKEYRLGEDEDGNTYLHFPQFCGADVRIYKRSYIPEPEFDEPLVEEEEEEVKSAPKRKLENKFRNRDRSKSKEKTPVPKKKTKTTKTSSEIPTPPTNRPSRLRQTIKTVLPVTNSEETSSDDGDAESSDEDATQSESESRSESEEPDGCNESGTDNNTPYKNVLRNRLIDRDNFSEASSVDSDMMWGVHRTRSGRIRINGAMRMNNEFEFENSCDFDGTLSENSNSYPVNGGVHRSKKNKSGAFKSVTEDKEKEILSENECISDKNTKEIDEKGDSFDSNKRNCDSEDRDSDSKMSDSIEEQNVTRKPQIEDLNEESSTSNDFSEVDSQLTCEEGNESDSSLQQKIDVKTILRIFDDKTCDKIGEVDSDTNSSFHMIPQEVTSNENEKNVKSNNSKTSPMAANTSGTTLSFGDVSQHSDTYGSENDPKFSNKISDSEGLSKVNNENDDTDTEFENEKMEFDGVNPCPGESDNKNNVVGGAKMESESGDTELHTTLISNIKKEIPLEDSQCMVGKKNDKCRSTDIKEEPEEVIPKKEENVNADTNIVKQEPMDQHEESINSLTEIKEEPVDGKVSTEETVVSDVKEEIKEESDDEEDETELIMGPEMGTFELVAESVEDVRKLVEKFAEPESYTVGRGKKSRVVKPPPRKRCVIQLHNRLVYLLKELEPWEQKLIQATKKARLKMKKEHDNYDEKDDDGWESDHSESTNSATEDSNMESVSSPSKQRLSSVPKDSSFTIQNEDSRTSEDCGEWDISLRGRIRKRRIIPNNVEDQGLSKKRKPDAVTTSSTNVVNVLAQGKPIQNLDNMVSIVTNNSSQGKDHTPGHLLLHTSGGQTYYTGLNQQSLSSLRMLSQTKQTAHPIIQQLLRQPGMTSPRPLVNTSSSNAQNLQSGSKTTVRPSIIPPKSVAPTIKGTQPPGKVQYFAANINSLPPAVIQQLIKSNALSIQAGNNQQGMILLTAVNPSETGGAQGAKATLTLQNPVSSKSQSSQQVTSSLKTTSVSTISVQDDLVKVEQVNQMEPKYKTAGVISDASQKQLDSNLQMLQASGTATQPRTSFQQVIATTPVSTSVMSLTTGIISTPISHQPIMSVKQAVQGRQSNMLKQGQSVPNVQQTSQQNVFLQNPTVTTTINQDIRLQNSGQNTGLNLTNNGGYILNTGQNQGVQLQLNPTINVGPQQPVINIGGQSLTLQQIQALALQGYNLQGISLQGSNLIVQPNAGLRIQNPVNLQGQVVASASQNVGNMGSVANSSKEILQQKINTNLTDVTFSGLPSASSCSISGICPPISPVIHSDSTLLDGIAIKTEIPNSPVFGVPISPGRSQCKYASNVTVKSLLEARKPSFTETLPENQGTIVVQSTSSGVKKLKLPSKAALDSAIQTVVTEVKTSLPTVNIKVPSPVSMPSIQPRRNITKTIQSMKVPIPTTPKVEPKTNGPITVQVSANALQTTSPGIGQQSISLNSPLQTGVLNFNQLNNANQLMLSNIKTHTSIPSGQNIVQGYLTPQGLIIPSANIKSLQNLQKVGTVSNGAETSSLLTITSPSLNVVSKGTANATEKSDGQMLVQNSRDLKHLQNVQDLRNIAAINANLATQLGTQQLVQKSGGISVSKNQVQPSNYVYFSPQTNLQLGSQILLNGNQSAVLSAPSTPQPKLETISTGHNKDNTQVQYAVSKVNMSTKTSDVKPLATVKPESFENKSYQGSSTVMQSSAMTEIPQNKLMTKIPPQGLNAFGSNVTLLSHLNSPVLKKMTNQLPTTSPKTITGTTPVLTTLSNKIALNSQQTSYTDSKMLNIQQPLSSQLTAQNVMQRTVASSPLAKQAPFIINQQGSSSEIIKQLAAAQVLGANVQQTNMQTSNLMLAGGNKVLVHMPGQSNNITVDGKMMLQLPGQLQLNTNSISQGKMVIPVPRVSQASSGTSPVSQTGPLKTVSSLASKVMIQVPGQSQTPSAPMLLISPQKHLTLGSQKSALSISKSMPSMTQSIQQTMNNPGSVNVVKTDTTVKSHNSDNVFKFSTASIKNVNHFSTTDVIGHAQQNTQNFLNSLGQKPSSVAVSSLPHELTNTNNAKPGDSVNQASLTGATGTPQKLFLYNINGQLVTAQGVPVTVDNGILKILPQPKIQMSNFNLPKSPPVGSKTAHHGNVPISPKPGQSITNTQQAYLNVLTSNANNATQPVQPLVKPQTPSVQPLVKPQTPSVQPLVKPQTLSMQPLIKPQIQTVCPGGPQQSIKPVPMATQPIMKIPQTLTLPGVDTQVASQSQSVVRNLNGNLNSVQTSNASALTVTKQTFSDSGIHGRIENNKPKPSYGFVVMPETGGQTQIVYPKPNIHSNQPTKNLVNNVQASASSSYVINSNSGTISSAAIRSPITKSSFVQYPSAQTLKMNNPVQKESNPVVTSTNSDLHRNMNGQQAPVHGSEVKSENTSTVDAEEAALNLLSLANQRFSS